MLSGFELYLCWVPLANYILDPPRNPGRRNTSSPKNAYVGGCHDLRRITVLFETNL